MRQITIGDVTVTSIIERDGPWRKPEAMFPDFDPVAGHKHLAEMEPFVYDAASGMLIMPYQTFVVRTPHHTILIDTCTGEDKGFPPPFDFPKEPWQAGFRALGLRFSDIDYVFCTHLHVDHTGWNTRLEGGRWVPSFPRAKYIFHRREYEFWEQHAREQTPEIHPRGVWRMNCQPIVEAGQALLVDDDFSLDDTFYLTVTPGHTPHHCCVHIRSQGREGVVVGDMMHHPLQCREPDWSTVFDWDRAKAAQSRRGFLQKVSGTGTLVMPVHFPSPTAGHVETDNTRFRYRFAHD
jgi:glyoxylase-like metal-dependent hydrolase (beta-lactamase superfamily II)